MAAPITFHLEAPPDLASFTLSAALERRLQILLERQQGETLSANESAVVKGIIEITDVRTSLLRRVDGRTFLASSPAR